MRQDEKREERVEQPVEGKRPWVAPKVEELPPLVDLTLQSSTPIAGSGGTGGVSF